MNTTEAKDFIVQMAERVGVGFHPDTPFEEYENDKGQRMFGNSTAPIFNMRMDEAYTVLTNAGIDPCEIALSCFQQVNQ